MEELEKKDNGEVSKKKFTALDMILGGLAIYIGAIFGISFYWGDF